MKTKGLFALSVLVLTTTLVNAQEFAPIGAEWYYSEHNGGAAPSDSEYVLYKSVKDSIINIDETAFNVKKIERTYYRYSGDTTYLPPYFVSQISDTVFLYNPDSARFDKLYIFNCKKGDTISLGVPYDQQIATDFSTYRLVIDSVATETHSGVSLKKYKISGVEGFSWISNWYMDRAGGLDWFTPRGMIIPEAGGPLRCYHDSEVDIKFVSLDCDYRLISSLGADRVSDVFVYPNPTSNKINIKTNKAIRKVELYNSNGQLLFTTCSKQVMLTEWPSGTYFLRIAFDKEVVVKEIIKP